ncbi:hypothetical protein [Actinomadura coerulea]|uniref:hypothetical protein n=1 Tax=Actinomadura coerulea TaxID=46159 RepID=UPI003425E059
MNLLYMLLCYRSDGTRKVLGMARFHEFIGYVRYLLTEGEVVRVADKSSLAEKSFGRHPLASNNDSFEQLARALRADTEFDDVDFGWQPERNQTELTIVLEGNKYEVLLQFTASLYNGPQPLTANGLLAEPGSEEYLAYAVHAEWDYQDLQGRVRVALCTDETTLLALLRGLRTMTLPEEPRTQRVKSPAEASARRECTPG